MCAASRRRQRAAGRSGAAGTTLLDRVSLVACGHPPERSGGLEACDDRRSLDRLRDFGTRAYVHAGLSDTDAASVVEIQLEADLRGVDTHGRASAAAGRPSGPPSTWSGPSGRCSADVFDAVVPAVVAHEVLTAFQELFEMFADRLPAGVERTISSMITAGATGQELARAYNTVLEILGLTREEAEAAGARQGGPQPRRIRDPHACLLVVAPASFDGADTKWALGDDTDIQDIWDGGAASR